MQSLQQLLYPRHSWYDYYQSATLEREKYIRARLAGATWWQKALYVLTGII
jgi:hypothetical protein